MPDPATLALFVSASVVLLVIPGPTIALVIARSMTGGRSIALPLIVGVGLGDLVAASLALAGAGALLAASATAFTAVKLIGAAYLFWLGVNLFRAEPVALGETATGLTRDGWSAMRDGFLVTLFNPKGILFFVAFVPQFIAPGRPYAPQAATFVLLFTVLGMANGALYAWGADGLRHVIGSLRFRKAMNRVGGLTIAGAGIAALFARRPAL